MGSALFTHTPEDGESLVFFHVPPGGSPQSEWKFGDMLTPEFLAEQRTPLQLRTMLAHLEHGRALALEALAIHRWKAASSSEGDR
jgi:hypothetical protein